MVCKEDICHWFRHTQSYEKIDILCKLLHLCSSHELRFIASIVEDQARKDFNTLRESASKANNVTELKKLCPDLFKATDRSTLLVYLSLLNSTNTVCSHVLANMLARLEAQRLACHLRMSHAGGAKPTPGAGVINSDIADDVILLYTMAAYHPAFSISQRLQLSDYLQKAETYLAEYLSKSEPVKNEDCIEGPVCASHGNTNAACVGRPPSPLDQVPPQSQNGAIKKTVHVKSAELMRSQWDAGTHSTVFHIQVTWSSGDVSEICRTYQQINAFHIELLRLFPKDSGAHRQERHIPYLPQERRGQGPLNQQHINKYIRQLSALPEHIIQCEHITHFFGEDGNHGNNRQSRQSSECEEVTTLMDQEILTNGEEVSCLAVPTAHAATTVVQQRMSYSSVVVSPIPHNSPLPSPLSSPHVSPSTNKQIGPDNDITTWLKNLRLHKYANLSQYSWLQVCRKLSQLDDTDLEREGLTDGAKRKFHKELESQLVKMVSITNKNGIVHPTRVRQDSSHSTSSTNSLSSLNSNSTQTPSPTPNPNGQNPNPNDQIDNPNGLNPNPNGLNPNPNGLNPNPNGPSPHQSPQLSMNIASPGHSNTQQHHPPVHLPLAVKTRVGYAHSLGTSVGSTNSIGSCSPGLSDCSGFTPPSSPRLHRCAAPPLPVNGLIQNPASPMSATPAIGLLENNGQDIEENNVPDAPVSNLVMSPAHYRCPQNLSEMSPLAKPGPGGDGPRPEVQPPSGPIPSGPLGDGPPPVAFGGDGPLPIAFGGDAPPPVGFGSDGPPPGVIPNMPDVGQCTNMPPPPHLMPIRMPVPTENGMSLPVHPMVMRPRTPLGAPQIRSPRLPGNGSYMGPIIPVGPANAATQALPSQCLLHNGYPEPVPHQGILMAKPGTQLPQMNPELLSVLSNMPNEASNKPPINYSVLPPQSGLMPRVPPSLMGPMPACHMVQRPGNLGIPTTNNGIFNGVSTPGHGSSPTPYDKGTTVHLPPTNIPPPITNIPPPISTSSADMTVPYRCVAPCNVTFTTGTAFTPTAPSPGANQPVMLQTPPPSHTPQSSVVSGNTSVGPSPPGTLVHPTPTHTPTSITTQPQHNSMSQAECTCRCNCQQCTGHSPQPTHPPPPLPAGPSTLQFSYQQQPVGWPQAPIVPAGYPLPGGYMPVSSNGLVNPSVTFPHFSPHLPPQSPHLPPQSPHLPPQSPYNNLPPELLFEARYQAIFHAANQGMPHAFHPQLHYPMASGYHAGLHHNGHNMKPHKNIMCYNCGQNGHMAYECKAPTMENLTRAQFHLNIKPRGESD